MSMNRSALVGSIAITLSALTAVAQGTLRFANISTASGIRAQVTVSWDGAPASGTAYLAQLYVFNPVDKEFQAVGSPVPFRTQAAAGFVYPVVVSVPFLPGGASADVVMRGWAAVDGYTWEQARTNDWPALGASNTIRVALGSGDSDAAPLVGLQPFMIVQPLSPPTNLLISVIGTDWGVTPEGFRFGVRGYWMSEAVYEACDDLASGQWSPIGTNVLTSSVPWWASDSRSCTSTFIDADWTNHPVRFYRARYLNLH